MKFIHRFTKIALMCALISICCVSTTIATEIKVTRVTDGDTIKVTSNGTTSTIRLVGIDAPETSKKKNEPGQPYSKKATKFLTSQVLNKVVDIKSYGKDRYGRTLAVVIIDRINVNLEMVKQGLAEVYRGRSAKGFDNGPYLKAEAKSREAKLNMRSLDEKYISPRDWRRMN